MHTESVSHSSSIEGSHCVAGCMICGSTNRTTFCTKRYPANFEGGKSVTIVKCQVCGFGQVERFPTLEALATLYSGDFFNTSQQNITVDLNGDISAEGKANPIYLNSVRRIDRILSYKTSGKLLDIGCAKGTFLKVASQYFDSYGVDISKTAAHFATSVLKMKVHCGDLSSANLEHRSFDVITLWDSLASMPNPLDVFKQISELMKPGALLVVTVPDITSVAATLLKRYWPFLIPPINLCYFSQRSMELMAKKVGIRMQAYRYESKIVSTNFILRKLGRTLNLSALDRPNLKIPFVKELPLNLFDIGTFYGVKE